MPDLISAAALSDGHTALTALAAAAQVRSNPRAILYSFRRCPYAIRARLALVAAGLRPGVELELREVALKAKPPELLAISAKGTVPVLRLGAEGRQPGQDLVQPCPPAGPPEQGGTQLDRHARGHRHASGAGQPEAEGEVPSTHGPSAGQAPGLAEAPGTVLAESLAIMEWALQQGDPHDWNQGWTPQERQRITALIAENDGPFKHHLDRFKYAGRFGPEGLAERQQHRQRALAILQGWNRQLQHGGWLLGNRPSLADMALLPFVRQFRLADPEGFDGEAQLEAVQHWLQRFLISRQLAAVMESPWAHRCAWRSPQWLYHLALREEWQAARAAGSYERSTRGHSLQQVGFVHLSQAHQVDATAKRFYSDVPSGELLLLCIDLEQLVRDGLEVRLEPAPGTGELFPHLYGALPLAAVRLAEPWSTEPDESGIAPSTNHASDSRQITH